jgi:hypothetical protein
MVSPSRSMTATTCAWGVYVVNQESDRWIWRSLVLLKFTNAANLEVAGTIAISGPIQVGNGIDDLFEVLHR